MNTKKSKLEAQKENFAEKKVNKISSNVPVIRSVCKKCKNKNTIRFVEREGYVCSYCDCTYLFAN